MRNVEMMNKNRITLDTVLKKANEIQKKCTDHKVSAKDIHIGPIDLNINFAGHSIPMSQLAAGHLCGKLQIPSRYFNRMAEAGFTDMAAENMNRWLQNSEKKLFVREFDGTARGILSDHYSVFDAPDIVKTVKQIYGDRFQVVGSMINEERMHLRMIENQMMDIDGEDLFAGVTIDSSDVGRSGLKARFFIWKQVCTNGMVISKASGQLFKQKHVGITSEDLGSGLAAGLESFEPLKESLTEKIKETREIPVDTDIESLVEEIKEATQLDDDSCNEVITFMTANYSPTRWGLINGITEVAQKFELERQLELEEIAANMLYTSAA